MNMLDSQCERLRDRADELRMLSSGMAAPYIVPETKETMTLAMLSAASEMREAADAIESLRKQVAKCQIAELKADYDTSRYFELFGTPERAAQLIADNCEYLSYCGQCWVRAANCDGKYSTVLEWLRGDA